jgi:polyisoprenyl-phosphate glycosyltransferase
MVAFDAKRTLMSLQGASPVTSKRSTSTAGALRVSLVVPVHNETESIAPFLSKVTQVLSRPELSVEIIFINDGSSDATLPTLLHLLEGDQRLKVIDLSRNFGKEAALTAGLHAATGEVIIPIDVDLQDPPEIILEMIEKWREGFEVVLGRRIDRQSDTWLKRSSAAMFYRLYNKIASTRLPENVGDFRLMDRCVVDALKQLPESRRFMKGLFAWVGFRSTYVDYVRPKRAAGETSFNAWRLTSFALEGITSFSTEPLRVWTYLGSIVSLVSFGFALWIVYSYFSIGIDVPGYASLIVAVTFLGGLQLIGIGILGEYLGRNYFESKRRPIFIVRKTYDHTSEH